ncbi:MAG TPA: hypothetical protein EYG71_07085 [Leucothrix sp.]|nr:hypothetical protein [Leucothrix sp.]
MNNYKTTSLTMHKAQGLSLVELMISMTLGLILIGGIMSMYLGSRGSDKTRTELSDIDTNARVALNSLRQVIEHAGYSSVEDIGLFEKPFYSAMDGDIDNVSCRDTEKSVISNGLLNPPSELGDYTTDSDDGDSITVIYLADHPDKGDIFSDCAFGDYSISGSTANDNSARQKACSTDTDHSEQGEVGDTAEGMTVPSDARIYSGFFLKEESGSLKSLVCYGSRSNSSTPQLIAENIDNMQFLYGVKIDDRTTYKTASIIEGNAEWESVVSVQVAILVGSESKEVLVNPKARSYQLLDRTVSKIKSDHRMYKVYTTTIALQNRIERGL